MSDFKANFLYQHFSHGIQKNYRYCYDQDTFDFLRALLTSSGDRRKLLVAGTILWRAQRGCREERHPFADKDEALFGFMVKCLPHPKERMRPEKGKTREGRVNPKGIPCLYLALEPETAMSEVRPGKTAHVTLAECKTTKDLNLVDCTLGFTRLKAAMSAIPPTAPLSPTNTFPIDLMIWFQIDHAFSTPVNATDDLADYAPTQVIAEGFRRSGYDGIVYRSDLKDGGNNVALFDPEAVDVVDTTVHTAKSVGYEFESWVQPWDDPAI
jgi:hypothetical protein